MSQRVSQYVSMGMRDSKYVIGAGKGIFFKYFIFSMSSLIGKLFFLSYPLFALGDYHIIKQIEEGKKISLEDAFEDSNVGKKYWTTTHFALVNHIIFLIGMIIIAGLSFGLIQMGYTLDRYFRFDQGYTVFVSQIISGCIFIVFIIQKQLYFGPVTYLIQSNEDNGLSDTLRQSALIMTNYGKVKLLYIYLYYVIRLLIYGFVSVLLSYGAYVLLPDFWFVFVTILLGVNLLKSMTKIMLAHKISSSKLFVDLIKEATYKSLGDQNRYKVFENKVSKKDILITLFEEMRVEEKSDTSDKQEKEHKEPETNI